MSKKVMIGASIGNCVHVAGVAHFLNLAESEGWETVFLGPAVSIDTIIEEIFARRPAMVCLGYRLTPANVIPLIQELKDRALGLPYRPIFTFGGTRPVAEEVKKLDFFDTVFDSSEDIDDCIAYLRGGLRGSAGVDTTDDLLARMKSKAPYPLLRHHFGLPDFERTRLGIERIADARVLDVISLGPDQNTQQFFYHPELADPRMSGAGGVPISSEEEFCQLKKASRRGNFPLMRCYSGTSDVLQFGAMLQRTIKNAWCAVPLCWYNELDGRGSRPVQQSIAEAQQLMSWHGKRNIPVELNEPHHWGLRDAHDTISVAMAYLAAYNARAAGVHDYIAQYMFNVPNMLSFSMDLAKSLAQIELVESLASEDFRTYREVRTGLPFLCGDLDVAKGQLAASMALTMCVQPDIMHVVGYSEAEQAATPEVVIQSCKIVRGVIRSTLEGNVRYTGDERVLERKQELLGEAMTLINFIESEYAEFPDPLSCPAVIADCICRGILDAPHIVKNAKFRGTLKTRVIDGKCLAFDEQAGRPISEEERLSSLSASRKNAI